MLTLLSMEKTMVECTLTSAILKFDVVCDVALMSTQNVLTTELRDLLFTWSRWAYSIPMSVVRPSYSSVVVHTFKLEYLWSELANFDQILCVASLGWGKGCIRFWSRLDQNSDFHGNRKPPLTYNRKNDVFTFSRLFLIRSFLYRPVWSESSLSAWRKLGTLAIHWAHSEDWSDWADAQADLGLRLTHMPFRWFCHEAAHFCHDMFCR